MLAQRTLIDYIDPAGDGASFRNFVSESCLLSRIPEVKTLGITGYWVDEHPISSDILVSKLFKTLAFTVLSHCEAEEFYIIISHSKVSWNTGYSKLIAYRKTQHGLPHRNLTLSYLLYGLSITVVHGFIIFPKIQLLHILKYQELMHQPLAAS